MNAIANSLNFSGKRVWVTGAGRGIGLATATAFHRLGADVAGLDCTFAEHDYPFATHRLDLSRQAEIQTTCQQLLSAQPTLDILVNAAGVLRLGALEDLSATDWDTCMAVNVNAVFHLVQQLTPVFKQQRSGVIINIASNAARVPRMGMAAYCASKSALQSFSHCVALELAEYGVRCNLVSPGSTDTPMLQAMLDDEHAVASTIGGCLANFKNGIPLGKLAQPEDIANSVLFLASDLAGHITLHNLIVDGGATLSA